MSRYFAEVDPDNVVLRVVVCDDPDWLVQRLGGTWVETADPYVEAGEVAYTGPGHGYDPDWPVRFAPQWVQPVAPDEEGRWPYNVGSVVFDQGRLWVSTVLANVQKPGVANWRNIPTTPGRPPVWVQPSGSEDTFQTGEHVLYPDENGDEYVSKIDANTTTPGTDDRWWGKVGDEPPPDGWAAGVAYATNDEVVYDGIRYRCITGHTSQAGWEPPNVPALWEPI